jgi:hypothetical protein
MITQNMLFQQQIACSEDERYIQFYKLRKYDLKSRSDVSSVLIVLLLFFKGVDNELLFLTEMAVFIYC